MKTEGRFLLMVFFSQVLMGWFFYRQGKIAHRSADMPVLRAGLASSLAEHAAHGRWVPMPQVQDERGGQEWFWMTNADGGGK